MLKTIIIFATLLIGFGAQAQDKFGLGLIIGDPTGISAKYGLKSKNAIDGALSWSESFSFRIHADYLWHAGKLFNIDAQVFDWYGGVGARFRDRKKKYPDKDGEDGIELGPRFPIGLRWIAPKVPLEVFAEVALIMNIIPSTNADLDAAIGARWFF